MFGGVVDGGVVGGGVVDGGVVDMGEGERWSDIVVSRVLDRRPKI